MIRKYLFSLILILSVISINTKAETAELTYEQFINNSLEYTDNANLNDISDHNILVNIKKLIFSLKELIFKELKKLIYTFSIIVLLCIAASVLKTCVTSETVGDTALFGCYAACAYIFAGQFKDIAEIGINSIKDLCDYMNVSFPAFATVLASSGYGAAATSMHSIFSISSNIIAYMLNNFITPIIYSSAILALSNGICNIQEIDNIIKFIIRALKYTIGILLTVFGSIMGFIGLTASLGDGIVIKTAKYAISSFIPIVGSCLADTLNNVIYTSILMKNSIGIIGITVILTICLLPIVKLFITSFIIKLLSYSISMLQHTKLAKMAEIISEIVSFTAAMLLFITVVFILLIGIIASIGV